ncbi:MAG: hypothetical protein ACOC4K_00760 [Verrucomicrobiota bacterium]
MLKDRSRIQHCYNVGPTGSGKSYIAKQQARAIRMSGYPVRVVSAKADPVLRRLYGGKLPPDIREWKTKAGADFVTHDPFYFPNLFFAGQLRPCCVVYDEGAADIGNNPDPLIKKFFRVCRDSGIKLIVNSQNYTGVSPQIRDQCKELHLFNCSRADLGAVINDYRFDDASEATIRRATDLAQYAHLHIDTQSRVAEIVDRNGNRT